MRRDFGAQSIIQELDESDGASAAVSDTAFKINHCNNNKTTRTHTYIL